jgi:bifunctional non-homologous end joining protein LigD
VAAPRRRRKIDWAARAAELPGARPARLKAEPFKPELAVLGDAAPPGDDWIHELKWDGYRLLVTLVDGKAYVWSRNALPWTGKVPAIAAAIETLGVQNAALDGELIAGEGRQADFNVLQRALSSEGGGPLNLALFDLVHLEGVSIEKSPLIERKALLEELLGAKPPAGLSYSSHVVGDGAAAFKMAEQQGFEGIISKRATRPYVHGRGDDWRKTKVLQSDEFAVVGYTPPKGSRTGFGSLLLARPKGRGWEFAGRVGTGFSGELIRSLKKHLSGGGPEPTVGGEIDRASTRGATWFEPRFVAEVFVRGYGTSGVLRQPSLKAVRPDKDPKDLRSSDRRKSRNAS